MALARITTRKKYTMWHGEGTDEECVSDDPYGITSSAADVGAQGEVKDAAEAEIASDSAQIHVCITDGPRLASERDRYLDLCVAGCGQGE